MSTPNDPAGASAGRPPVVDLATWQAARDELLAREKAHTHEGDAIAAARRRLPMVEFDGKTEVTGPGNPTWGPTSRPAPQWTRPGATPAETLGRQGHHR